jgi:hypothetical protein
VALAIAAVGLASAQRSQSGPLAARDPSPLLGIAGGWRDQKLVRLDPRSLRPLSGPALAVFNSRGSWAFSPGRSRLALGTGCQAGLSLGTLQLIDVSRMRPFGCFAVGPVDVAAWPTPHSLLVVASSPFQIFVIDPKTPRIVKRTTVEGGGVVSSARAGDRLVLLTGRLGEPQRLVVVDARGSARSVGVEAPGASDFVLDPGGRRAFIVSGGGVVDVDLGTLVVAPAGLRLIDSRAWTVRTIDEQVSFALLAGDVLLGVGASEIGLVAYDLHGTKRFQLLRGRSPAPLRTFGSRAYVDVQGRPGAPGRGRPHRPVVGPRRAPFPTLLVGR